MMIENDKKILELKPMMKVSELIPYLKNKNIKFEKISEKKQKNI